MQIIKKDNDGNPLEYIRDGYYHWLKLNEYYEQRRNMETGDMERRECDFVTGEWGPWKEMEAWIEIKEVRDGKENVIIERPDGQGYFSKNKTEDEIIFMKDAY